MHKLRLFIYILFPLFLTSFFIKELPAQPPTTLGDTAEILKYEINQTRYRVYYDRRDDGGEIGWVTVHEGDAKINIADANVGSVAGGFFSSSLPPGHISKVEKTISGYFLIQAKVSYSGNTYYSKSDGTASLDPADYAEATIPLIGEGGVPIDSITNEGNVDITISADTRVTLRLSFNLLSANDGGTTGCVGIVSADTVPNPPPGATYVISPRQPNVTKEIVYD